MTVKIVSSRDLVEKNRKVLIYSPAGHGKTRFLGTAQDDSRTTPILILDFEGGMGTLEGREDIAISRIRSWDEYNEVYGMLRSGKSGYKSVGIDSISETQIFSLLNILETQTRKDPDLLTEGDYGRAQVQMRRFLRAFRDLPLHVFFTALCRDDTDPREGLVRKPALVGRMADEVLGIVDIVGYLALSEWDGDGDGKTEVHRVLLLQNYPRIRCKVRAPWNANLPNEIDDPDVTKLLDVLEQKTLQS